jgi:transcriptional regulator with XRE-family HTH domain
VLRARLREDDVAARLGVDPKTVRRWLNGRVPYPHRSAIPRALWVRLFGSAEREIAILAYSALFLAEDAGVLRILADKGARASPCGARSEIRTGRTAIFIGATESRLYAMQSMPHRR